MAQGRPALKAPAERAIVVRGARVHNLRGLDVDIPRDRYVVITGLSGSGKSSLAFDTIYAEGQRRYVESLSAYARQFLGQMKKPEVDVIEGLSPAISIDQKSAGSNPRSTVGTTTEVFDYLRLLFARIGLPHCPSCGDAIERQSPEQIATRIGALAAGTEVLVLAPVVDDRKGEFHKLVEQLAADGYARVRIDGSVHRSEEKVRLQRYHKHTIEAVVDRLTIGPGMTARLTEAVEGALALSGGLVTVNTPQGDTRYSEALACPRCGFSMPELQPRMFSFNSPHGACTHCQGLGALREVDPSLVVPDGALSLSQGAVRAWANLEGNSSYVDAIFRSLAAHYGFSVDAPWNSLPKRIQRIILLGSGTEEVPITYVGRRMTHSVRRPFEGVVPYTQRRYTETDSERARIETERYMSMVPCPACEGTRLRPEARAVTVGGMGIAAIAAMPIGGAAQTLGALHLLPRDATIAKEVLKEILARLRFLQDVGLSYLALDRASGTLSGGESQRIRLATQIGSGLVGVLYVLDEPSIGLHQRDNQRLIATLKRLRDLGNTLIIVEHDEETIREADWVIDLGPGAGKHGGTLVAAGTPDQLCQTPSSLTGAYLSGRERIPLPAQRRAGDGTSLVIRAAAANNLRTIDVTVPLQTLCCITGVSGSGKSTLVHDVLYREAARRLYGATDPPGVHGGLEGLEHLDKAIVVDQSPIGRTPRSNPATYTGVFTDIRDLFAATPEAKARGYELGRFSFNVRGGRCESCEGAGLVKIEMHFLADLYLPCDACGGKRYNDQTLQVRYKGKNIHQVLEMTVEEALAFFGAIPKVKRVLQTLSDVGLDYVTLGQQATTLSGGEAQRIKLATELAKPATGRTLYILDEPTTGLHFADIRKLLQVLGRLVDAGNTVLVIEHNLDVIKTADHLIDLGPEGGDEGGLVVACGTPEQVARTNTHTGRFLAPILAKGNPAAPPGAPAVAAARPPTPRRRPRKAGPSSVTEGDRAPRSRKDGRPARRRASG